MIARSLLLDPAALRRRRAARRDALPRRRRDAARTRTSPAQGAPRSPRRPSATTPGAPGFGARAGPGRAPFREVVKNAKESAGFFTCGTRTTALDRDPPRAVRQAVLLQHRAHQGRGRAHRLIAGSCARATSRYFKRVNGNHVQLIAKNTRISRQAGTPTGAPSRRASPIASSPRRPSRASRTPRTRACLVEVNQLLLNDIPGASTLLEGAFHIPYALDGRNSSLVRTDAQPTRDGLRRVRLHFSVSKMPPPSPDSNVPPAARDAGPEEPLPRLPLQLRGCCPPADASARGRSARGLLHHHFTATSPTTSDPNRTSTTSIAGGSRRRIPTRRSPSP